MESESLHKNARLIYEVINKYRKNPFNLNYDHSVILETISYFIINNKPIKMVLPACHGKAAAPASVISYMPDMGEYLGIKNFASLCEEINKLHKPGSELILIHEGHFYTQTPLVESDDLMDKYLIQLRKIIDHYPCMTSLYIKDFFPQLSYDECRSQFIRKYAPSKLEVNELRQKDSKFQDLYIAYKKIYTRDILPQQLPNMSQRNIERIAIHNAVNQLRIYIGFGRLEKEYFVTSPYLRLTALYKDPAITNQIAIDYLVNQHHMATPAFYCVLKRKSGDYCFIKKIDALKHGYKLKYKEGYLYYHES